MSAARRLRCQDRAAWFLLFFFLLPLVISTPQAAGGHQEHVGEHPQSPPIDVGEHVAQAQQQLTRLGSRPPCCERKCGACAPCKAVQVRAPQCADYEPVGWKCKCGAAIFDP